MDFNNASPVRASERLCACADCMLWWSWGLAGHEYWEAKRCECVLPLRGPDRWVIRITASGAADVNMHACVTEHGLRWEDGKSLQSASIPPISSIIQRCSGLWGLFLDPLLFAFSNEGGDECSTVHLTISPHLPPTLWRPYSCELKSHNEVILNPENVLNWVRPACFSLKAI